jgi:PQQ-dependent dehydrogenase (methanol/ethanol family)
MKDCRHRAQLSWLAGVLLAIVVLGCWEPAGAVDADWSLFGQNDSQQHFSPLSQINDKNVSRLGIAWATEPLGEGGVGGVPLVAGNTAFVIGFRNTVYAIDLGTGHTLWSYTWPNTFTGKLVAAWSYQRHRGLALWHDRVMIGTADCHLVALDQKSGEKIWSVSACDPNDDQGITGAPRIGGDKIFIGQAGADAGARGHIDAFAAQDGRHLWHFDVVPRSTDTDSVQRRALETWSKDHEPRGGTPYDSIVFDPKTNLVYVGTGGPYPWNPAERGRGAGDELFTDCIVALNADTGAYVWHYQSTPQNAWNWESAAPGTIADLNIGGRIRHVYMYAPKNGFFYVLDAQTGELISAKNFMRVTWASGIDPKTGRPIQNAAARYDRLPGKSAVVWPSAVGGHAMQPLAFNPQTQLVYFPILDRPGRFEVIPEVAPLAGRMEFTIDPGATRLLAWDPIKQRTRWQLEESKGGVVGNTTGVLTTAGNLVLDASNGLLRAMRADNGKLLQTIAIQSYFPPEDRVGSEAPSTVEANGSQIILLPVDTRLVAFALNGSKPVAKGAAQTEVPMPKPPLARFPAEQAARGQRLYTVLNCVLCHGNGGFEARNAAPDLLRSSAQTHSDWDRIVVDGLRVSGGMPKFANFTDKAGAEAIEAYVINEAWKMYDHQSAAK